MRVWLVCFLVLFGSAEFLQWLSKFSLPLPVFILGGVFLAVISNYDKLPVLKQSLEGEPDDSLPPGQSAPVNVQSTSAQLPNLQSNPPRQSISFTIRKPFQPGD